MPVFIRPARVTVDEGGGVAAWVILAIVGGGVLYAIWSLIGDIVLALGITVAVAVAGLSVILWAVLRRNRAVLYVPEPPRAVPDLRAPALGASRPAAVEGARPTALLGIVLNDETEARYDDAS